MVKFSKIKLINKCTMCGNETEKYDFGIFCGGLCRKCGIYTLKSDEIWNNTTQRWRKATESEKEGLSWLNSA